MTKFGKNCINKNGNIKKYCYNYDYKKYINNNKTSCPFCGSVVRAYWLKNHIKNQKKCSILRERLKNYDEKKYNVLNEELNKLYENIKVNNKKNKEEENKKWYNIIMKYKEKMKKIQYKIDNSDDPEYIKTHKKLYKKYDYKLMKTIFKASHMEIPKWFKTALKK